MDGSKQQLGLGAALYVEGASRSGGWDMPGAYVKWHFQTSGQMWHVRLVWRPSVMPHARCANGVQRYAPQCARQHAGADAVGETVYALRACGKGSVLHAVREPSDREHASRRVYFTSLHFTRGLQESD